LLSLLPTFLLIGVLNSGIYALFAVGLSLIFGVMGIINVAHGEMFTIGGYLAFVGIVALSLHPGLTVGLSTLVSFLLGFTVYLFVIRPLHNRLGGRPKTPVYLVLTLGLSIFLQNVMLAGAGSDYKRIPIFVKGSMKFFGGSVVISNYRVWIFIIAMLGLVVLFLFLKHSKLGLAIRAVTGNPAAAQAIGIKIGEIYAFTFGLAGALAGLAGVLLTPILRVYPTVGFLLTITSCAIIVLGGMDNLLGVIIASFVIGISESLATLFISSEWRGVVVFGIMVAILIIRPSGLAIGGTK